MFLRNKVLVYCALQMLCSLIFWPWALYNVLIVGEDNISVHGGIDFGIFSFPFIFFAGLNGLTSIRNPHVTIATKHAFAHLLLTIVGHCAVTLNYIAGAILGKDNDAYMIYCSIAAVLFAATGALFSVWAYQWKTSFEKMTHALSLNMY
mmetsp:Transcript_21356/g.34191  ORF Transcript_21356/g.34191 Transcript_21356/m.34191 type:complete len:149 (+) Transcript_21356:2097-2543(+)